MKSSKHRQILDECIDFLNVNGVNVTGQLSGLISFFFSTDKHFSFEEIKQYIHSKKIDITDTEIRDTMQLLVEYGFAIEKEFVDGVVRYEHHHYGEHHDHLYCFKCGTISEFYSPVIESEQHKEAISKGFHVFSHKMQIYGLCETCFGKSSAHTLPLAMVEGGAKFIVKDISDHDSFFESGLRKKLLEMGIISGSTGEILTNTGGRIVVIINGVRLALGRGMSQSIQVVLTE